MKKQVLGLFFGVSILAMANTDMQNVNFSTEIKDLDLMYNELVEKEHERFKFEENKADEAKKEIEQLTELKAKIITALENREVERAKRFFKDDFDALMKKYKVYLKAIDKKIEMDKELISEFNIIKDMTNNN